jgi:hypothetical protein
LQEEEEVEEEEGGGLLVTSAGARPTCAGRGPFVLINANTPRGGGGGGGAPSGGTKHSERVTLGQF